MTRLSFDHELVRSPRLLGSAASLTLVGALAGTPLATVARARQTSAPVFRGGTELVLVNIVVRDRSGGVVRGLTRDDFTLVEDGRPQTITSFDFEELDRGPAPASPAEPLLVPGPLRRSGARRRAGSERR